MSCLKKIKIGNVLYEADTNFRTAIKCNQIAIDGSISDFERTLGIICTMFGSEAINLIEIYPEHSQKLLDWVLNYLSCGEEIQSDEQPDMDYVEDMDYIEASFMSDYQIDLENTEMDWHKFVKLINGLSNSDMGNCCILNRIRNLRNYDIKDIKDPKERQKIAKAKQQVALKKYKKENNLTKEQEESMRKLNEMLGL